MNTTINLDDLLKDDNKGKQPQPQEQEEAPAVKINWNEVFTEWCYKIPKGYPTIVDGVFTEYEEVKILNEILEERGFDAIQVPEKIAAPTSSVLNEGATEDNSEVLCMYYMCVDNAVILASKEYLLNSKKAKEILKPQKALKIPAGLTAKNLGANGATALQKLLADYNAGKPNVKVFVNAITSAEIIRKEYGDITIPANTVDRGPIFDKLKSDAVKVVQNTMGIKLDAPDKWSPADIMIYNAGAPRNITGYKNLVDINNLFTVGITTDNGKIVGISLKQSSAQGGKALSFKKTLTRESFNVAEDLDEEDKVVRSCLYLSQSTRTNAKSGNTPVSDSDKIGYIAEIAVSNKQVSAPQIQAVWTSIVEEARSIVTKTFSKDVAKKLLAMPQSTVKKEARTQFLKLKNPIIKYSKEYDNLVKGYNDVTKSRVTKLYKSTQQVFLKALGEKDYKIINRNDVGEGEEVGSSLLIRKASCYTLAAWLLTGMAQGGLKIPKGFTTLAKEKNPFIALTAYAIGYAGISPYFIKVIGAGDVPSSLDKPAHTKLMGGDGMLVAQKNQKIEILDSKKYAGFQAHLMLTTKGGNAAYDVTLDFRFAGSQINIEVSKIA